MINRLMKTISKRKEGTFMILSGNQTYRFYPAPLKARQEAEHLAFCCELKKRGLSEHTIRSYSFALRQFYSLYPELSFENRKLYKLFLLEHYKPQTVNLRIQALNAFHEYQNGGSGHISMVKLQQKNYFEHVISKADYEYLKSCLLRDEKYLCYFLIRYMAATGARVSEVVQIQVSDVQAAYKNLYSKGNKVHRIYIPKALQSDTLKWLSHIGIRKGSIFLNRFGNPITPGGIRGLLKAAADRYHLSPEVVHPHAFRHRFAKSFIEQCGDIALLSDLLGHSNLETTRIYLRRSYLEQYEIINRIVNW